MNRRLKPKRGEWSGSVVVAPFIGQPSPFPVAEELREIPTGAKVDYMDCGMPICALMWEQIQAAAKAMGLNPKRIKAGPDGTLSGESQNTRAGELMANYVIGEMSDEANIVVYDVPELSFTVEIDETLTKVIEEKCSGCSVSTADIQVATLGNTAPTTVVSDLQAHSDADLAVFTISEISIGRPAAGLEVETLSYVAGTSHLQYIKGGKETASLGYDIAIGSWMLVEMAAPPDRRLETLRRRGQRLRHDPVPSTDRSTSGPAWAGPEVPIGKGSRPACHSS